MKSDPEAPLSAHLQGSPPETRIASPSLGDGRLSSDGELPEPAEPSKPRRRARIAAVGAIVVVGVAIALAILLQSHRKPHASSGSGLPAGDVTVAVQRRTLTEHAQVDGTLGYGGALELYDRIPGTFTWLPGVGSVVQRGGTLFKINQLPIVLMYGAVPAYRTLKQGVSDGQDVAQLNENLIALGYDPYGAIADDERFSEATAAAVRRWQKAEGLPQTGEVELGRVIFAPSARRVTAVKPTLGQDPPGGEGSQAPGSKGAPSKEPAGGKAPEGEEPAGGKAPAGKEPAGGKAPEGEEPAGGKAPEGEEPAGGKAPAGKEPAGEEPTQGESAKDEEASKKEAPGKDTPTKDDAAKDPGKADSPSKGTPSGEEPSGGAGAGTPVLTTTSTQQLVQLQVEADKQQLARVGRRAPVTLPSGQVVNAHITSVGTVATESGGGGGEGSKATISVTLTLDRPVPHLDAAPVTVELVKERRRNVLTIPAPALIATAGGGYAVQALEGGRRVEIPVTPGMFADGYVQIEGEGVHEGMTVTQPSE